LDGGRLRVLGHLSLCQFAPLHDPFRICFGMGYCRIGLRRPVAQLIAFVNAPAITALRLRVFLNFDFELMIPGHGHIMSHAANSDPPPASGGLGSSYALAARGLSTAAIDLSRKRGSSSESSW
jgi:hypothetical protein